MRKMLVLFTAVTFIIFSCNKEDCSEPEEIIKIDTIYLPGDTLVIPGDTLIIPIDSTLYDVLFETFTYDPTFYHKWDVIINIHNDSLYFNEVSNTAYATKAFKNDIAKLTMDSIHSSGYYTMRISIEGEIVEELSFEAPGWALPTSIQCVVE